MGERAGIDETKAAFGTGAPRRSPAEVGDQSDPTGRLDEPAVLSLCWPVAGRLTLDLGCGVGRYGRLLAERGARLVGVDRSPAMLQRARAGTRTGRASWLQASLTRLPLPAASFERVVSGSIADPLPDLAPLLAEAARVLAPDGRVVLTLIHPDLLRTTGPAVGVTIGGRSLDSSGHAYEPAKLEAEAARCGLEIAGKLAPRIDRAVVDAQPSWRPWLGVRAFLIYAFRRS